MADDDIYIPKLSTEKLDYLFRDPDGPYIPPTREELEARFPHTRKKLQPFRRKISVRLDTRKVERLLSIAERYKLGCATPDISKLDFESLGKYSRNRDPEPDSLDMQKVGPIRHRIKVQPYERPMYCWEIIKLSKLPAFSRNPDHGLMHAEFKNAYQYALRLLPVMEIVERISCVRIFAERYIKNGGWDLPKIGPFRNQQVQRGEFYCTSKRAHNDHLLP